jgi:Ca2+-binding RTX toxin-like protein
MIDTVRRSLALVSALAACLAVLPTAAWATTVSRDERDNVVIDDNTAVVDQVVVDGLFDEEIVVTSTNGTPITALSPCTQASPTVAACPASVADRVRGVKANLSGGDDTIVDQAGGVDVDFDGGDGNDTLTAGFGTDLLRVGPGDDRLNGNNGNDTLEGGPGNDVEIGGNGDDRLGGADGTRAILDTGADTFEGGNGSDLLFTADAVTDSAINCSVRPVDSAFDFAGTDLVDPRTRGCDLVQVAAKDQHPTVQVRGRTVSTRGGRAAVRLQCPRRAPGGRCDGTVTILKGRRVIARGNYRLRGAQSRTVRLRLRRRATGRAEIVTRERDTQGRPETTRARLVLV